MYNKLILIGNLTRDMEMKQSGGGLAIGKSAIATTYKYKAQDGSQKEEVCFIDFSLFGKAADIFNQYTHKGSKVMLEGRLVFETWVGTDGQNHSKHSLRVDEFKFLDSKNSNPAPSYSGDGSIPTRAPENKPLGESKKPTVNLEDLEDEPPF